METTYEQTAAGPVVILQGIDLEDALQSFKGHTGLMFEAVPDSFMLLALDRLSTCPENIRMGQLARQMALVANMESLHISDSGASKFQGGVWPRFGNQEMIVQVKLVEEDDGLFTLTMLVV